MFRRIGYYEPQANANYDKVHIQTMNFEAASCTTLAGCKFPTPVNATIH